MELEVEELRIILKLIRFVENTNGGIPPEIQELRDKIKFEFGL